MVYRMRSNVNRTWRSVCGLPNLVLTKYGMRTSHMVTRLRTVAFSRIPFANSTPNAETCYTIHGYTKYGTSQTVHHLRKYREP